MLPARPAPNAPKTSQVRGSLPSAPMNGRDAAVPTSTKAAPNQATSGCVSHHGAVLSGPPVCWRTVSTIATRASTADRPLSASFGSSMFVLYRFHRTIPRYQNGAATSGAHANGTAVNASVPGISARRTASTGAAVTTAVPRASSRQT